MFENMDSKVRKSRMPEAKTRGKINAGYRLHRVSGGDIARGVPGIWNGSSM
jgi:hypothetical protein